MADRANPHDSQCIGCKCTDSRACEGGCSWSIVDRDRQVGVCSRCDTPKLQKAWNEAVGMAKKTGADFLDCLKATTEKRR